MRIVVTVRCADHVHFFKHAIRRLEADGHDVSVFARENPSVLELLERFEIPYVELAGGGRGLGELARAQVEYEAGLLKHARRLEPDVMTAVNGVAVAHVAALVGARSVVFTDTERTTLIDRLALPLVDAIYAPERGESDAADETRRYRSYHELAYLHPNRFTPDRSVRSDLEPSVDRGDQLVLVAPVAWSRTSEATDDDDARKTVEFVERLEREGATVRIAAETALPDPLERRRLTVDPHRIHDVLACADLFVGESATAAIESAVLGTPAIYVTDRAVRAVDELEEEYGLAFTVRGCNARAEAFATAVTALEEPPSIWQRRRERLLANKSDMTNVIVAALDETDDAPRTDVESMADATHSR